MVVVFPRLYESTAEKQPAKKHSSSAESHADWFFVFWSILLTFFYAHTSRSATVPEPNTMGGEDGAGSKRPRTDGKPDPEYLRQLYAERVGHQGC